MTKPLISVIIPVYRTEAYLDRCLETVVSQTYQNLDIILIDDGSPDHCPAMCDLWAARDSRIRVVHKANGGIADARNRGLREALGEYVAFVDSDDWISLAMFERLEEAMERHSAQLVMCQYIYFHMNGDQESHARRGHAVEVYSRKSALKELLKDSKMTNHLWRNLYKREVIPLDVFPTGKCYEDIHAMYKIFANCKKIVYLNDAYYFYMENASGITQTRSAFSLMDFREALLLRRKWILEKFPDLQPAVEQAAVSETLLQWVEVKRSHDKGPALQTLQDTLRNEISAMDIRAIGQSLPRYSWALAAYALSLRLCPWSEKLSDAVLFSKDAAFFNLIRKMAGKFYRRT